MTRQHDIKAELKTEKKIQALYRALEFGIAGALESQGQELLGLAIRYEPHSCLLTLKGKIDGVISVCHVGSDTMPNCVLKTETDARHHRLRWKPCKYSQ